MVSSTVVKGAKAWFNKYMPIILMTLTVISFGLFANFISESTKSGGNTQLYTPAWMMLAVGLLFAIFAYITQRREDRQREQREREREQRDIQRLEQEKKLWTDVQLFGPKRDDNTCQHR